ncbi:MAG: hypothetical protein F6K42_20700, partial [Leptolyngbya sp. SIO1D8]|nr:hypothetical protein [Leptolyngbya sp. SIO1D8]
SEAPAIDEAAIAVDEAAIVVDEATIDPVVALETSASEAATSGVTDSEVIASEMVAPEVTDSETISLEVTTSELEVTASEAETIAPEAMPPSEAIASQEAVLETPRPQPPPPPPRRVPQLPIQKETLTAALNRFEPDELRVLVKPLQGRPETAAVLKPFLEQRLAKEPTNLAALYLRGALAQRSWNQPQVALESLAAGFQAGLRQTISPDALLLFYQEAVKSAPAVALSWLTQADSPWNTNKHLPFLIREAGTHVGTESSQYRLLLMLYRIRSLKAMLPNQSNLGNVFPQSAASAQASTVLRAI